MGDVILKLLAAAVERDEPVALATVVETDRSVPRRAGAKMLIKVDGSTVGTIGGGEMEAQVTAEGVSALGDGRSRLLSYDLVDPSQGDVGICGGAVSIFVEPYMPSPTLFVVGCGHVGRAVVSLGKWLGFTVVATDDRPEIATEVEGADDVVIGDITAALAAHPVDDDTWVVVVTRNAELDLAILPEVLATPAPYVGVMGSSRRWHTTRAGLEERGVSAADIDRVHSPIGIEVAAETPEEIAVSILAEVIGHRRG